MTKRTVFSTISPLPAGVSREVVLEFLHHHTEMIDLNPLVIERHFISTPENVDPDERDCLWYSMTDKIDYLPGGKVSGDITYTCAFHDLRNGLQTHCRAPLGVDIRSKWTLNGSLPGEPPERRELGIVAPASGLYLREEVTLSCSFLMTSFVKKNLKKSHATLVDRLVEKAKHVSVETRDQAPAGNTNGMMSVAPALSHSWLPPTQTTSTRPYASSQETWRTTPPQPRYSTFVQAREQTPDSTLRYSHTSSYHVPQPYRAPSQQSTKLHVYTASKAVPNPPLPSPDSIYTPALVYSAHPAAPSVEHNHYISDYDAPLYLDGNLDIVPAPLRVGCEGARSRAGSTNDGSLATHSRTPSADAPSLVGHSRTASSTSSSSSLEGLRGSGEYEHPVYRPLNPYSPVLTDGSSSPDEPHLGGHGQGHGQGKGYFDEMDHPMVLRPGSGGLSGRLSARLTGPFVMGELD